MTGRIVCVGDLMVDVLAVLPGALSPGSDTPATISVAAGGSAANTAAWLAREGAPVVFVGRVGLDAFGQQAEAELASAGVISAVTVDPTAPTGVCIVLVEPDGERTMIPSAGANARLTARDVLDAIAEEDRLHLSAYPLLRPESAAELRAALTVCAGRGVGLSVDAASAAPLLSTGAEAFLSWLPWETVLIANADEARTLTGLPEPTRSAEALARRVRSVVVKIGGDGAVVVHDGRCQLVETVAVAVVDSTGAGDAFAAGLLAALAGGADLAEAARSGHRLGAEAVGQLGARPRPT